MKKRMFLNTMLGGLMAVSSLALSAGSAAAEGVTLKLHQFLPPVATVPKSIIKPWAEAVTAASNGEVQFEHYDAMALGGKPPELMDQAIDGVADIVMTVVGYTPGRFPRTEVFELPFMMTDPVGTSLAFQHMIDTEWKDSEYSDVKVLGAWVHGPGVIHTADGVASLEDMEGLKLRGPTRVINDMLKELGATPVGMPLPAIPEALSKGVVDGTVIPWEVTPAIRLTELVGNHTEFGGEEALYTATIVMVMNKAKYDSLSDSAKAAIDAESGAKLAEFAARVMHEADAPGRAIAVDAGNSITTLTPEQVAPWKAAAEPVVARWVEEMNGKDIDGQALINQAKALIEEKSGM